MKIRTFNGYTLDVRSINLVDIEHKSKFKSLFEFSTFHVVRNFDVTGPIFFYIGKGHPMAPKQIVVWYPNGRMWCSYGKTIQEAIEGAMKDGWKYTD